MRKKPDILLILVVLVVSGVVISNFVVFKPGHKNTNLSLLNSHYSRLQLDNSVASKFKMREVVHIDSSKQQIH